MPIHKNDLPDSIIKAIITCPSDTAPSMIVQFVDGSDRMIDSDLIKHFIEKHSDSKNRGLPRTIGKNLESKLKVDFPKIFS